MRDWLGQLSLGQVALYAAGLVAVLGLGLALATSAGREHVALLGLRVADALVELLERLLSAETRAARRQWLCCNGVTCVAT